MGRTEQIVVFTQHRVTWMCLLSTKYCQFYYNICQLDGISHMALFPHFKLLLVLMANHNGHHYFLWSADVLYKNY